MGNKKCFIEVIQCSGEDMNLVLTNGIAPPALPPLLQPGSMAAPQLMLPPPSALPAAPLHHSQQLVSAGGQGQLIATSSQHHVLSPGKI